MLRVVGFCVNLYATGLVLHHFSFTLNLWRSPLARKVALWVFASVVAIELVILVPSYQRRRQELIAEQVAVERVDHQLVQRELNAYVLRIAGLVLLISIVVTATAMLAVSLTIIQPLLKLRDDLLWVGDVINADDYEFDFQENQEQRQDELGELFQAFRLMFVRVKQEIRDRRQIEASLAAESLINQQIQEHSQELQQLLRELRGTQAQLIHSEKMASMGQLVAGIAHEFNNPVNFIHANLVPLQQYTHALLGVLEQYQMEYAVPSASLQAAAAAIDLDYIQQDLPKLLMSMETGTQRIRAIVDSLRNFSRLDEAAMKRVNIHEGIDSTLMLLQHRLKGPGPPIKIVKDYGTLPLVECFANQLNQVFMGLISNAIDALVDRDQPGLITLSTQNLGDAAIQIVIRDNGQGIASEHLSRVFDPFFTTKPIGQGTGLGLSVSYQIIQMHGGGLHCDSMLGEGTTFTIVIPIDQTLLDQSVVQVIA
jgi:signal transduction histidine kinase